MQCVITAMWSGNLDFYVETKYVAAYNKMIIPHSSLKNVWLISDDHQFVLLYF